MNNTETATPGGLRQPEADALAQHWVKRVEAARQHWAKLHKRMAHNRQLVAGFDWSRDPGDGDFYRLRANLIFSTMSAILPHIYARNPEISVTPLYAQARLKRFCHTLETVTNRALLEAQLKKRAKAAVWSAMSSYFGIVKVMYQRDMRHDPVIENRMQDIQTHLARLEQLIAQSKEVTGDQAVQRATLEQTLASLQAQVDVVAAEGVVIDRVRPDHLLFAPGVSDFWSYEQADWMAQRVPMKRSEAQARYQVDLSGATPYEVADGMAAPRQASRFASFTPLSEEDTQICLIEIWDKASERVYTLAEGCPFFVRPPYSPPKVGVRWYPFFLLPFSTVDGSMVAPCLVDLTEKLQKEHNDTRNKFAAHRELNKPHWLVSTETREDTIKRHANAALGEVVLVNANGLPLDQVIQTAQGIPVNPADYDTSPIRMDWEQVTGLQDASRSTINTAKTATEASIMQQALSGRVAEFRDRIEDWLQEIARYTAQILLQELTPAQVERYMGPPQVKSQSIHGVMTEIREPAYDWPQLSRDQAFDMVQLEIRAGTTGAPDKLAQQENWLKALPVIGPMIAQLMEINAKGGDAGPVEALLRETLRRFDERLDIEQFLPHAPPEMPPAPSPSPETVPPPGGGGAAPFPLPTMNPAGD